VDLPRLTQNQPAGRADEKQLELNEDQKKAFEELRPRVAEGGFSVNLLHGVTGSGKTEVYLRCIAEVVERGKRGLVLVPEIALTPQTVLRFMARFKRVAVLHSGLSATQRHQFWQQISQGDADVVVGARSAVFAPLPDLGVIVVDEEHDSSYKQDQAPRYHARDVAIKRAQIEGVPIILGSATPSLEMYRLCRNEKQQISLSVAPASRAGTRAGSDGTGGHAPGAAASSRGASDFAAIGASPQDNAVERSAGDFAAESAGIFQFRFLLLVPGADQVQILRHDDDLSPLGRGARAGCIERGRRAYRADAVPLLFEHDGAAGEVSELWEKVKSVRSGDAARGGRACAEDSGFEIRAGGQRFDADVSGLRIDFVAVWARGAAGDFGDADDCQGFGLSECDAGGGDQRGYVAVIAGFSGERADVSTHHAGGGASRARRCGRASRGADIFAG
jgi:DEAD/DEAH box helicase